jgi:hypothetical protein
MQAIVRVSKEKMPVKCWGRYVRVAVIITDGRDSVAMISPRAAGVLSIVRQWRAQHVGSTERRASARAEAEAHELADELCDAIRHARELGDAPAYHVEIAHAVRVRRAAQAAGDAVGAALALGALHLPENSPEGRCCRAYVERTVIA